MTTPVPTGIEVPPPPVVPYRYGLLSTATFPPEQPDNRWEAFGLVYMVDGCGPQGGIWASPCAQPAPPADRVKTIQDGADFSVGEPFTVYESARCLAMGFPEASTKARRRFDLREQWWVEQQFAATAFADATDLTAATAVPLPRAVALLEDAIADTYGGLGVVHVPRFAYAGLAEARLIERNGLQLRTPLDNLVAVGAGYSGNSPTGAAPAAGTAWIYATGPVRAWRSETQVREEFDPQRNTRLAIAERTYALTFDCLKVAALAQL